MHRLTRVVVAAVVALLAGAWPASAAVAVLSNGKVSAEFGERGLIAISDTALQHTFHFERDNFSLAIGGTILQSEVLNAPRLQVGARRVVYAYSAGPYELEVVYELGEGWRFLSKQLFVRAAAGAAFRVNSIEVFGAKLFDRVRDAFILKRGRPNLQTGDYAAFLRFEESRGLLAVVQNPFLQIQRESNSFSIRYAPEMDWRTEYGPFASDRGLLAPYGLTRRLVRQTMVPEWALSPPGAAFEAIDEAEVEAFTECVRAFLLYKPARPLNIMVGWCVNDYQIDIAAPEGREEYKRVIDRAAELGAEYVLFAPSNSELSRRAESADDWGWENLLWLGLGQKIRKNEWDPRSSPVPSSVREMLDYARSKNVKLVAYVYPVVPFAQNPEWLVPRGPNRKNASLGVRSLQDWLIDTLAAFYKRTGIGGYAFDHTFLGYEGASRYAQWWGWRRVMETLRQRIPEVVIDGRQAYHLYGPWSWLAGSYPHPTFNDEQPESFRPFPDLHFDRVSANRQRFTAYRYRNLEFAPSEITPGFITHQTPRNDESGRLPQTQGPNDAVLSRFRARDWDYLGWRYSLLSSIATGGWNNVLNMIPARDLEEHRHFSDRDRQWFRRWIDWTAANKEFLRNTRTIIGQPAMGRVDGTSAILGNKGYLFLFNPNGRKLSADFPLNESMGLKPKGRYLLKELYPREGTLVGRAETGVWNYADAVSVAVEGGSAAVLELLPAPESIPEPLLFNLPGKATLEAGVLDLTGVQGEVGTWQHILVWLPGGAKAHTVRVNGQATEFSQYRDVVSLAPRFEGLAFRQMHTVGEFDRNFAGGTFTGKFTVPARILTQLAERKKAWPIPWTEEDYKTTWLVPERLLLFVQIAEPDDKMEVQLKIDGQAVELRKAYSSVRVHRPSFVGFYADVSSLAAGREHDVELQLPPLKPGQFQGLFFENVETEYTGVIAR